MNRCLLNAVVVSGVLAIGSVSGVQAAEYFVSTLDGSQAGFGYDSDGASGAPAIVDGAFHAQGVTGQYQSVQIHPSAIGMTGLKLGDIESISYDTKQLSGAIDWQFKIYTVSQPGDTTWYNARLKYALNDGTSHDWTTFTRDENTPSNRIATNATTEYIIQNNPTQYSATLNAAKLVDVWYIEIAAGAASGGANYDTFLRNITINPTAESGFEVTTVNAVPEPAALSLIAVGAAAMLRRRRA